MRKESEEIRIKKERISELRMKANKGNEEMKEVKRKRTNETIENRNKNVTPI